MSDEPKIGKWGHSIVDVCMLLHGCDKGTGDGIAPHDRKAMIEWLRWRTLHWDPSPVRSAVDDAVLQLAIAVVDQADEIDSDRDEESR